MKKIILVLMFAFCACFVGGVSTASAESDAFVRVIYSQINTYSTLNINDSEIVKTYKYNETIKLAQENEIMGEDGLNYYIVQISETQTAYVLCSQVLPSGIKSPQKDLDGNATLKEDAMVFNLNNEQYVETQKVLKIGTKVKVLDGLDYSKEYSRIQYSDQNGQIIYGYIKTQAIEKSGISRTTIGAIVIVVTTISLTLLVFGIKGKKKKKSI